MMLELDSPKWSTLRHGYGNGADIPSWISALSSTLSTNDSTENLLESICNLCHQWSTYDGTYAAIPHLVAVCSDLPPNNTSRIQLLEFIGWSVACLRLNQTEADSQLIDWFEQSVPSARNLIAQSLPHSLDQPVAQDRLRNLLGAFAACHGNPALAFVLYELDAGGFKCDSCNQFIRPMESSLNPFWCEQNGK